MGKYEQFAMEYLEIQDEIELTDENIEKLGAALEEKQFDISFLDNGFENPEVYFKWKSELDDIAENVCK